MESLFTKVTVLLTQEYTKLYSPSRLLSRLSTVRLVTGICFSKANETFALSGTWEQVNQAFELLQHWNDNPGDEPHGNQTSGACCDDLQAGSGLCLNNETDTDIVILQQAVVDEVLKAKESEPANKSLVLGEGNEEQEESFCSKLQRHEGNTDKESNSSINLPKRTRKTVASKSGVTKVNENVIKNTKCASEVKSYKANVTRKSSSNTKRTLIRTKSSRIIKQTRSHAKVDKSIKENQTNEDLNKKEEEKSDKENEQRSNNINSNKFVTSDSCEQKLSRKPGEKGYWSRVKISNYNEEHTCAECGVTLKSRKRYMEHMRRIHVKEFQCDVCFRRFGYPTDLHRHKCPGIPDPENKCKSKGGRPKKEKVSLQVTLPCPECDYVGTSQKRFTGHMKRNHRLTQACDLCDKKFGFVRDLERHKRNVHTNDNFFCDRCSKMYKSITVLQLHLKTHEEGYIKPKFACDTCGKLFTTKYSLSSHNKMEHLGMQREYLCQVCGKKFRQRNSYKQHMNAHNGVKPYTCDICDKGFTYHKSLKEHKYMHDNIRRFQCSLCEKTFRQRTTLQIHMKVHKTIKDHICSRCGKGFSQKQALERHERIHSGVKPYTCVPCQRTFGDASTIRRHMKAIHQKTDINWKDEIVCNLKRKTDYYVLGGSGQNRTYKSKLKNSDSHENEKIISTNHVKKEKVQVLSPSSEPAVLSIPQTEGIQSGYKPVYTLTELNNLQSISDQSHSNLHSSSMYGISTAQLGQNVNFGTNPMQVVDFPNLQQSDSQLPPEASSSKLDQDNMGQLLVHHNQIVDLQSAGLMSSASVLPVTTANESSRASNQPSTNQLNNSDTVLNQTLASLWGIVGYPALYSANLAQYHGSQNP